MPKVVIDDIKGLYQQTGTGLAANGNCQLVRGPSVLSQVSDASNNTTITTCESGYEYHFGTTDGVYLSSDGNNTYTFALPTPAAAGERITFKAVNAAAIASSVLLGFTVVDESAVTISYQLILAGASAEVGTTEVGTHGTQDTMIKITTEMFKLGDVFECISVSKTKWLMTIRSESGLLLANKIIPDPGNAGGYID